MELELDIDHPLAQSIMGWSQDCTPDMWLVLKNPTRQGGTHFRARLTGWGWNKETDVLTAVFESWEDFMEQQAKLQGI